ncbi:fatty-acid amide hydrolase 2-A-like [Culicoides brevitarsis]|uniref:fatty-acid amide hydrolase 2-A-like n=1 Tax=Culicoides brevitarsis TaxID=469753 RepID=UPI00307B64C2
MPLLNISPLQFTLTLSKYSGNCILPFVHLRQRNRKFLPPIDDSLLLLPLHELAERIREQRVTSVAVVVAYIARILQVDPILKAVMDERFAAAIEEARTADRMCQTLDRETLKKNFPLLGVPFTVKESIGVHGMSQSVGVLSRKNVKCRKEGLAIQNLRAAGAIPLCVTNVPEWCLSWETQNKIVGRTVNPYNTVRSPGGSSGGEAALIASAASLFGIGTDFIGSCRLPAMFCGVFGHRPSRPLISLTGPTLLFPDKAAQEILTFGPMTRYAKDLPIVLEVMCGTENAKLLKLHEEVNFEKIKVLYCTQFSKSSEDLNFDPEVLESLKNARNAFSNAGADIEEADLCFDGMFETLFSHIMGIDNSTMIEKSEIPQGACFKEYVKWACRKSNHTLFAINSQFFLRNERLYPKDKKKVYEKRLECLKNEIENFLKPNTILVLPTFPTAAYRHFSSTTSTAALQFVLLASVFNLPATSIPMGLNKKGLPIGIQVIAGRFQDRLCFAAAKLLEERFGGWQPPSMVLEKEKLGKS